MSVPAGHREAAAAPSREGGDRAVRGAEGWTGSQPGWGTRLPGWGRRVGRAGAQGARWTSSLLLSVREADRLVLSGRLGLRTRKRKTASLDAAKSSAATRTLLLRRCRRRRHRRSRRRLFPRRRPTTPLATPSGSSTHPGPGVGQGGLGERS